MGIFKRKSNIVFLFIIFLLVAALAGVSYFAYLKNNDYKAASKELTTIQEDNESELAKVEKRIEELESEIAELETNSDISEQEKAELNSQLQSALEEKARLEKENSSLKSENSILLRRKALQDAIRLNAVKQSDTAKSGVCYLTFDDGPSDNTLKILDILDTYNAKATFFVVGTAKTQYLPKIAAKGHAIGLHSTSHKYNVIYDDIESYLTDVQGISDIVYKKTGIRSNLLRFPGGSSNVISKNYCEGLMTDLTKRMPNLGYAYFDWNVVSGDADVASVPAATIANNVLTRAKGKKSICVLMHDTSAKSTTVEALPAILEGLSKMGFRFEKLTAETFGFHQNLNN